MKFIENTLVIVILLSAAFEPSIGTMPLTQVLFLVLFFILLLKRLEFGELYLNRDVIIIFSSIFFITFILNYDYFDYKSIKSFIGLIIYTTTFYWYIFDRNNSTESILKLYILAAFIVSIIAIIQEVAFLLHIQPLYDFSLYGFVSRPSTSGIFIRATSIFAEPAHLGAFLTPAVFLGYLRIVGHDGLISMTNFKQIFIIFLAFVFTFSVVAYAGLLLAILFLFLVSKLSIKKILLLSTVLLLLFGSYIKIPMVEAKIKSFTGSLVDESILMSTSGLTAFAIISNTEVMLVSMQENPIFGTGLNSHRLNYDKYIEKLYPNAMLYLNSTDAASIYIRVLSEFGLFGLLFIIFIFYKYRIKSNKSVPPVLIDINMIAMIGVFTVPLRNGQYLNSILIFMFILLLRTYKIYINAPKEKA